VERVYEHYTNERDKATLAAKLHAHGEAAYESSANARDKITPGRVYL